MLVTLISLFCLAEPLHWGFSTHSPERFADENVGGGLIFDGASKPIYIDDKVCLPDEAMTVGAWVSIDEPTRWGGIIGCIQDNDDLELGWILGYNESQFTMALSTTGADDGNGTLTYLSSGDARYELGKWYYVASTYDGKVLKLYIDGELVNQTNTQSGPILYNKEMPFTIGGYEDDNELNLLSSYNKIKLVPFAGDRVQSNHSIELYRQNRLRSLLRQSQERIALLERRQLAWGGKLDFFHKQEPHQCT